MTDQPKSCGRIVFWFFGSMLAILVVLVLLLSLSRWQSKSIVQRKLAAMKAANEPASPAELNLYYNRLVKTDSLVTPDRVENAWLLAIRLVDSSDFQEAVAELPVLGSGPDVPPSSEEWPEQPQVVAMLRTYESEIDNLHRLAAQLGPVHYPSNFARLFETNSSHDHFGTIRSVARLLVLEAHVAVRQQDGDRYVRSVTSLMKISDSMRCEPLLVSMLVRNAIESTAGNLVQSTVNEVSLTDEQTKALIHCFEDRRHLEMLRTSLIGERALAIPVFLDPSLLWPGQPHNTAIGMLPGRYSDFAHYLDVTDRMLAACDGEWPDAWSTIKREQASIDAARGSRSKLSNMLHMLSLTFLPAVDACAESAMRVEFISDACRAAFALEAFRRIDGAYPQELDELIPAFLPQVPSDPFDGKPLRYQTTDDGFRLYSIGPDMKDDQGYMDPKTWKPDMVFQVPAPVDVD